MNEIFIRYDGKMGYFLCGVDGCFEPAMDVPPFHCERHHSLERQAAELVQARTQHRDAMQRARERAKRAFAEPGD